MKSEHRITSLGHLAQLAQERRSVWVKEGPSEHRYPAAYVMNRSGSCIYRMFLAGMFLNIPKKPIDPNKPARKFKSKPLPPKPVLNLPYYPNL